MELSIPRNLSGPGVKKLYSSHPLFNPQKIQTKRDLLERRRTSFDMKNFLFRSQNLNPPMQIPFENQPGSSFEFRGTGSKRDYPGFLENRRQAYLRESTARDAYPVNFDPQIEPHCPSRPLPERRPNSQLHSLFQRSHSNRSVRGDPLADASIPEKNRFWSFDHQSESQWIPEPLTRLAPDPGSFNFEKVEQCDSVCVSCKEYLIHKSIPLPEALGGFPKPSFNNLDLQEGRDRKKLIDYVDVTKSKQLLRNPLTENFEHFSDVELEPFCPEAYADFFASELGNSQMVQLKNLFVVVVKLLSDQEVKPQDFQLSEVEAELLLVFVKKKKFRGFQSVQRVSLEYLNRVRREKCFKRTEEHFKYVFKKCFRFMAGRFRESRFRILEAKLKPEFRESKFKFDYTFYGYYFGRVAEQLNLPIEKFFHFKIKDDLSVSTKTVSKLYLGYLKMNPHFLDAFKAYIRRKMIDETYYLILSKTKNLMKNWESLLSRKGVAEGLQTIRNNLTLNVKSKLPWSIQDVRHASELTLSYIEKN